MNELHDKARDWQARSKNTRYKGQVQEADELIAALLAEVERLTAMVTALKLLTNRLDQDRADLSARAEAAEARLRELASAVPVACVCTYEGSDGIPFSVLVDPSTARRSPPDIGEPVPLIRRPEMSK